MKLYIRCRHCNNRIYINSTARTRNELPFRFTLQCLEPNCFLHGRNVYSPNDVYAESEQMGSLSGAIILGGLGLLSFGILGGLIGGGAGFLVGRPSDNDDMQAARIFDESRLNE